MASTISRTTPPASWTEPAPRRVRRPARSPLLAALCATALAACSGDDDDAPAPTPEGMTGAGSFAFVSGNTPAFDAGQFERFTLGDEIVASGTQPASSSDIAVATDGTDFYQVGRSGIDSLTRYDPDDLETPIWQYSVNGEEVATNPQTIVFASATKAYVIRYDSPLVWVVDPSATDESAFLTGTIDLSAYDDVGTPNAVDAVIVGDRLYVALQRLGGEDEFTPVQSGYVAVVDTATDTEIDTAPDADGLPGIELETRNPQSIAHLPDSGDLLVVSEGYSFATPDVAEDPYTGGLELVDLETLATDVLLDDGTREDNVGYVVGARVASPDKGYVLTQAGFGERTLRTFDPRTGLLVESGVAGLAGRDLSVLAVGPDGRLWIGGNDFPLEDDETMTGPGFVLIDPATDTVVERVTTGFNPSGIVFVE